MEDYVQTRSSAQSRSHAQKFLEKINSIGSVDVSSTFNSIKHFHDKVKEMNESEYSLFLTKISSIDYKRKIKVNKKKRIIFAIKENKIRTASEDSNNRNNNLPNTNHNDIVLQLLGQESK